MMACNLFPPKFNSDYKVDTACILQRVNELLSLDEKQSCKLVSSSPQQTTIQLQGLAEDQMIALSNYFSKKVMTTYVKNQLIFSGKPAEILRSFSTLKPLNESKAVQLK